MRLLWVSTLVAFVASSCSPPTNPCVSGCDGGTAGGAATGGGTGGTGGSGGSGGNTAGGSGGSGGACAESWTCGYWVSARDGGATRTCLDQNACPNPMNRPPVAAALPALDLPFYKCQVHPVVTRSCGMVGCHGQLSPQVRPFQVLARARQRNDEIIMYNQSNAGCLQTGVVPININNVGTGTASCNAKAALSNAEWSINYDSARALAIGVTNPDQSELLTQPLWGSPFAHSSIKMWHANDPQYAVIRQWLDGGTALATCTNGTNN